MIYHERKILTTLHRHFDGHKYQLSNSYIFYWESDYFGMTSSGYCYEIEVKISRSDFKADMKKYKHSAIKRKIEGKTTYLQRGATDYYVELPNMRMVMDKNGWTGKREHDGTYKKETAWFNGGINPKHKNFKTELISSYIYIKKVPDIPNKFFYIAPKGMIKVHEVPHYAGLLTIENNNIVCVKTAPFIHKEKLDLTKILLDKFYHRCLKLETSQIELF